MILNTNENNLIQKMVTEFHENPNQLKSIYHNIFLLVVKNLNISDRNSFLVANKSLLNYWKNLTISGYNRNNCEFTTIKTLRYKGLLENQLFSSTIMNKIKKIDKTMRSSEVFPNSKPFTRWWWLNGPFNKTDIKDQLIWLKKQGFGGVELAWVFPSWDSKTKYKDPNKIKWLSDDFKHAIALTKKCAQKLNLGCDFTFGSCWPFGGSFLASEDRAQTFKGPSSQTIWDSWEAPIHPPILNHLSSQALKHYMEHMGKTFEPGLKGHRSSLFCDSLEISSDNAWSPELWEKFEDRFGYSLKDRLDEIDNNPHIRYDSRKILSEAIISNFYKPFTTLSHQLGAMTRVQCHGAPADLLSAYASVDVPESESILFDPWFSRIPASAATLAGCSVISCETFTCLYGFNPPKNTVRKEQIDDLKLLFDAVVANGVNQIVWHGMPFNPLNKPENKFYASVHLGPDSFFIDQLCEFNHYMETICGLMRQGVNAHRLAIYLPNEDMMMLGELPPELQTPGARFHWEMRHVLPHKETEGFLPIWLSGDMLARVKVNNNNLCCGDMKVPLLYIDVEWLDISALSELLRIVKEGGRIVLNKKSKQPGFIANKNYEAMIQELIDHPNVLKNLKEAKVNPLLEGENLPPYWAREYKEELFLFFAHPSSSQVKYPMRYCQYQEAQYEERSVKLIHGKNIINLELRFKAGNAIMLKVKANGNVEQIDLKFEPQTKNPSKNHKVL